MSIRPHGISRLTSIGFITGWVHQPICYMGEGLTTTLSAGLQSSPVRSPVLTPQSARQQPTCSTHLTCFH
ncbi:hypothetical protein Q5P01_013830 [Channa striata]|uniref:Uncharacterized protein n=1 Tax=Channa striata TaxID=64152 RepID=A0AA88SNU4_CHASR|nr:hypothetical protein Q5P01_013830 [Channa striata]